MRAVLVVDQFVDQLRELSQKTRDPGEWLRSIYEVAAQVAAGRAPGWVDDHQLRGAWAEYRSFKPFTKDPDLMVIYSAKPRSIVLADIGPHSRFFTKGRKTRAKKASRLKSRLP